VHEPDPDDPVEILGVLPERFHDQFLAEYYQAASEAARQVDGYRQLHDLLRRWRLIAAAYPAPGFEERQRAVHETVRTGSLEGSVPIEEILTGPRVSYRVRFEDAGLVQMNGLPSAAGNQWLRLLSPGACPRGKPMRHIRLTCRASAARGRQPASSWRRTPGPMRRPASMLQPSRRADTPCPSPALPGTFSAGGRREIVRA
jgi:hypothetical protein